jgi:prepilin-type N-terminal cleavage/methylation domain-containing protein
MKKVSLHTQKIGGFTLIELIVAIAIIAIIAVVAISIFSGAKTNANDAKKRSDLNAIAKAFEVHYDSVSGTYPCIQANWFAGGVIPTPPEGGSYNVLPTEIDATTCQSDPSSSSPQGYAVYTTLSDGSTLASELSTQIAYSGPPIGGSPPPPPGAPLPPPAIPPPPSNQSPTCSAISGGNNPAPWVVGQAASPVFSSNAADSDGTITNYNWTTFPANAGTPNSQSLATATYAWTPNTNGNIAVQLTVTDSGGLQATCPVKNVSISGAFGLTSNGTSAPITTLPANFIHGSNYAMPTAGTVTHLAVYFDAMTATAPNNQAQVAIYSTSGAAPNTLLRSSSSFVPVVGWNIVPLSSSVAVTAGNYFLMLNTNIAAGQDAFRVDTGVAQQYAFKSASAFGTWLNPFGAPTSYNTSKLPIFAIYN